MMVSRLTGTNFRNVARMDIEPAEGINLLTGENAQGKTSTLEMVYLLSVGRALRGSRDTECILEGLGSCQVSAVIEPTGTELGMELCHGKRKRGLLNSLPLPRASDLLGRMPSVCFWSGDLGIVSRDPSVRRLFMDTELCQIHASYLRNLTVYKRALEHRNALLKTAQESYVGEHAFEPWEQQLGESGMALRSQRRAWVSQVALRAGRIHSELAGGEVLQAEYVAKDESEDLVLDLANVRRSDIARGTTSVGPHRDDLDIRIGGRAAREYGSQGQQRTAVISLKLAVFEEGKELLGFPPVLLLDDIFSDLDRSRREHLIQVALSFGGQTFLTCTESEQAGSSLSDASRVFLVKSGTVARQ